MDRLKLIKTIQVEFRIKAVSMMHTAEFRIKKSLGMKIKRIKPITAVINRPKVAPNRPNNSERHILPSIKGELIVLIRE